MREWQQWGKWRGLVSAVAIGVLLGVTGPFGSQTALSPAVKYVFWMAIALTGFGGALAADRLMSSTAPGGKKVLLIAAASALPMTFFVAWAMGVVRPGRMFTPLQMLALYPYVALVQLPIAWLTVPTKPASESGPAEQPAAPEYPPEFLAKLPPALRRDILALEAEDHYLRVHTLHGSALILMRLADAVALIDPRLGLRVHRSWWVARDAVRALERISGRAIARLVDGTKVPISRAHLQETRATLSD